MASSDGPGRWAYRAFRAMPGPVRGLGNSVLRWRAEREVRAEGGFEAVPHRLLIGPRNTAGQAWQWARAVERHLPGVSSRTLWAEASTTSSMAFAYDWSLSRGAQLRGLAPHRERVLSASHVLSESGRALLGDVHHADLRADLAELRSAGVRDAVVIHGSEARDLREHAERYAHSPFTGDWDDRWHRMQAVVDRTRDLLADYDGPVFVTTPDLLDFVPGARLLPITVDVDRFTVGRPVLQAQRPVVLHAPSNPRLKGTAAIEAQLLALQERGLVSYRRIEGVPNAAMPDLIASADVVVDQVVLGNPGTLVAESLAAGRVVVAHVAPHVRRAWAATDPGGRTPPVVEADPATVGQVVAEIAGERAAYQELAAEGPVWAHQHHDGRAAAAVLGTFLQQP